MAELIAGFRFRVFDGAVELGFQKVSGIGRAIEVETYREGGVNDRLHVFPKGPGGERVLSMEKGVAPPGFHPFQQVGQMLPAPLIVEVLDENRLPVRTYSFFDCLVKSWQMSALSAQENALLIDTFEVSYTSFLML